MAPDRSSGRRGIGPKLESAPDQPLHSLFILDNHDQINAFHADLQAPATTCNGKERRRAPSLAVRQVATPRPFSAPNTNPPLSKLGTTATHLACSRTSSGMPLSGAAMISCRILPA